MPSSATSHGDGRTVRSSSPVRKRCIASAGISVGTPAATLSAKRKFSASLPATVRSPGTGPTSTARWPACGAMRSAAATRHGRRFRHATTSRGSRTPHRLTSTLVTSCSACLDSPDWSSPLGVISSQMPFSSTTGQMGPCPRALRRTASPARRSSERVVRSARWTGPENVTERLPGPARPSDQTDPSRPLADLQSSEAHGYCTATGWESKCRSRDGTSEPQHLASVRERKRNMLCRWMLDRVVSRHCIRSLRQKSTLRRIPGEGNQSGEGGRRGDPRRMPTCAFWVVSAESRSGESTNRPETDHVSAPQNGRSRTRAQSEEAGELEKHRREGNMGPSKMVCDTISRKRAVLLVT